VRRIWDGSDIAQEILVTVRQEVRRIRREGRPPPMLAEISVGESPLHRRIGALHADACRLAGITHQIYSFPPHTEPGTIVQALVELNGDPTVTGVTIDALPLLSLRTFAAAIAPEKDVDGLHPLHFGRFIINKGARRLPCGADIVHLLTYAGVSLVGACVACIGNRFGVAGTLALLCLHEHATVSAWRGTSACPIDILQRADVIILDTEDLAVVDSVRTPLKSEVVVVDARHHPGEYLSPCPENLAGAAALLIQVPGGVGPTTVARRLASLVAAYRTPATVALDS
jgi:methylenetetrahydrofolate dehydrogenase (NADP+)/methenyltetrahydrofolate cyclohydrolase